MASDLFGFYHYWCILNAFLLCPFEVTFTRKWKARRLVSWIPSHFLTSWLGEASCWTVNWPHLTLTCINRLICFWYEISHAILMFNKATDYKKQLNVKYRKCLQIRFTSLVWFTKAVCVFIKIHCVSFHVLHFKFKNETCFKPAVFASVALIEACVGKTLPFVILWGESSFANTPSSKLVKSYANLASGSRRSCVEETIDAWINLIWMNKWRRFEHPAFIHESWVLCVSPSACMCVCKQQLGPPLWLD